MARVKDVRLRQVPLGPGEYGSQLDALEANPTEAVVDAVFSSQKSAEAAAFRVNSGRRKDWPSDRYYGIWDFNAEADGDPEDGGKTGIGRWELLIGVKEYMPEGWRSVVEAPGSRRKTPETDGYDGEADASVERDNTHVDADRSPEGRALDRVGAFSDAV